MNPELSTPPRTLLDHDMSPVLGRNLLVVVDMQVGFAAALEPWLLDSVEAEICRANQASWSIIALEFLCPQPAALLRQHPRQSCRSCTNEKRKSQRPATLFHAS